MSAPTAHEALSLTLADALEAGLRIACAVGEGWLSEDVRERARAAERCDGCPCLAECDAAGLEAVWGVWGGVDRSPRQRNAGRPRRAQTG